VQATGTSYLRRMNVFVRVQSYDPELRQAGEWDFRFSSILPGFVPNPAGGSQSCFLGVPKAEFLALKRAISV
jgi:hypothetical protein